MFHERVIIFLQIVHFVNGNVFFCERAHTHTPNGRCRQKREKKINREVVYERCVLEQKVETIQKKKKPNSLPLVQLISLIFPRELFMKTFTFPLV